MVVADEQSYEEVISKLQTYTQKVQEAESEITEAGNTCVEKTEEDPGIVSNNGKLQKAMTEIDSALESIGKIISELQEELEEIRRINAQAQED